MKQDIRAKKRNSARYSYDGMSNGRSNANWKQYSHGCNRKAWRDELAYQQNYPIEVCFPRAEAPDICLSPKGLWDAGPSSKCSMVEIESKGSYPSNTLKRYVRERSIIHRLRTGQIDLYGRYLSVEYGDDKANDDIPQHPLFDAIKNNDFETCQKAIEYWPKWIALSYFSLADRDFFCPLDLACRQGNAKIVNLLADTTNSILKAHLYRLGHVSLWLAMKRCNHACISILLRHGGLHLFKRAFLSTQDDILWLIRSIQTSVVRGLCCEVEHLKPILKDYFIHGEIQVCDIILFYASLTFEEACAAVKQEEDVL